MSQRLLQAWEVASRSKGWRSWERASVVSVGTSGCLEVALSPGSLPHKEAGAGDWADGACFIPGNKHPLSLPLIPAGSGQFNPFHPCSYRQILCCWQRMGEHLSGFQRGPLPSLTDIGITMGRDAQHRSSKPFQPHSQEHAQGLWQGRVPRAACECTNHGALPLPTIDCQSSTRLHPCQWSGPCPVPESHSAIPGLSLHHAASMEPTGGGSLGKPSSPLAHTPWLQPRQELLSVPLWSMC